MRLTPTCTENVQSPHIPRIQDIISQQLNHFIQCHNLSIDSWLYFTLVITLQPGVLFSRENEKVDLEVKSNWGQNHGPGLRVNGWRSAWQLWAEVNLLSDSPFGKGVKTTQHLKPFWRWPARRLFSHTSFISAGNLTLVTCMTPLLTLKSYSVCNNEENAMC